MFFHFVKKGDNLYDIAHQYKVDENRIIMDNGLIEPKNLVIGQCLLIDNNNLTTKISKSFNGYCYEFTKNDVLKKELPYLTYLSIFSYKVNEDGSLNSINDEEKISLAKRYDVKPIMVITNSKSKGGFSPSLAHQIISNENIMNNLFNNIDKIIYQKGYYGLNIDFEYVNTNDKDLYIRFIKKLRNYFNNLYISVSLAPKYSDNQKGLLYEAHDYEKIGKLVNNVIIMTYEWGYTFGPAMPVAPLNEVEKVIKYAISKIDSNKIMLGIPNYGYDFLLPYKEKQKAKSISNLNAIPLAFNNHAEIFRSAGKTPYFKYKENVQLHEVHFDDPCSFEEKLNLIDKYNLSGGSIWTISTYTPYLYKLIDYYFKK